MKFDPESNTAQYNIQFLKWIKFIQVRQSQNIYQNLFEAQELTLDRNVTVYDQRISSKTNT